ncbi:helix-turn-helix domain-containing protein [Mucilaginibacter gilvus]|nr:AraC family transcriptional regulator [Mucilaginibacter gilvus]
MELPKPHHPLLTVVNFNEIKRKLDNVPQSIIHYFYSIALKRNFQGKLKYGQQDFDFDSGMMHFMSPKQLLTIGGHQETNVKHSGWLLLIHPDFLWNTTLAKKIKGYEYFSYKVSEALYLSEKEEVLVSGIVQNIEQEYQSSIDSYSQEVIISHIELLLTYSERFYQRQFITRKIANHKILIHLEALLIECCKGSKLAANGFPTVKYVSEKLNVSPNYLSRLLKTLTGQSTIQIIQDKLIDFAKERLSTTELSVNEIAYELGFEHPQSFSKFFKIKTNTTPLEFRNTFN